MRHLVLQNFPFRKETARFLEPFFLHDWSEMEGGFALNVDMPGLKKEDIKITTEHGFIAISANRKLETKNGFMEKRYEHSFYLPEGTDPETLEASYDSGVLKLSIKAGKPTSSKEISVK